jgi:3-deoxy-D-manno-octulosonic-acid transferase
MPRPRAPMRWWIGATVLRVAERPPLTIALYRQLTSAATPLAPLWLRHRLRQQKEHPERLRERYGETTNARPQGPVVWLHAASVGEMLSVIPLIERLRARHLDVLVTSGTLTSAWLAGQRLPENAIHQFVPLDMPRFVARFLDHWRPDLALFVESDLWPNLIMSASERGIPLSIVNGRLSERSFRRWGNTPRLISTMLRRFDLCLAQSKTDAERYENLGARRVITTGNLKLDVPPPSADEAQLAELQAATAGRLVIAAASTHPGEEEIVFEAHRLLKQIFPALLTVVAPRHPERGAAVADMARGARLDVAVRSNHEMPSARTDVYVADTLGELGLLYRIAPIALIGGSLVPHGGQNPIEAAKLGAAILHGPHVRNFADLYSALDDCGGAWQVKDATSLARQIEVWLKDPPSRQTAAQNGLRAVASLTGGLERTILALDPYLTKLRLERPSSHA